MYFSANTPYTTFVQIDLRISALYRYIALYVFVTAIRFYWALQTFIVCIYNYTELSPAIKNEYI